MDLKSFWYIAAESRELERGRVLAAEIMDERIALFRDEFGRPVGLQDRCLHRCASLSRGKLDGGRLQCGYHGWTYDRKGRVVFIPSDGPADPASRNLKASRFETREIDDYVYARLDNECEETEPFRIPFYRVKGWATIRLRNRFNNSVVNCAENFVDIPHTAFVHPVIFRDSKRERFAARVERKAGSVIVEYFNERSNLGLFSWFLNARGREIKHADSFHMPNVTSVDYAFDGDRRFIITSQSIPAGPEETIVYTDLTYNYGIWNALARPIIRRLAQKIIDQDIMILNDQMKSIKHYGRRFNNSEADVIHVFIESIIDALERGEDPRSLPDKSVEIEFWV